jgi:hypothetical protein
VLEEVKFGLKLKVNSKRLTAFAYVEQTGKVWLTKDSSQGTDMELYCFDINQAREVAFNDEGFNSDDHKIQKYLEVGCILSTKTRGELDSFNPSATIKAHCCYDKSIETMFSIVSCENFALFYKFPHDIVARQIVDYCQAVTI